MQISTLKTATITFALISTTPVWAAGPSGSSILSNPLAITLLALMALLLVIIGVLANILIGAAELKYKKSKINAKSLLLLIGATLLSQGSLWAQEATTVAAPKLIGGMSVSTFYLIATVLFLELFIIIALLINIKFLVNKEKSKFVAEADSEVVNEKKAKQLSWWDRINLFRPIDEEKDLDLGHEYDGIRELDNRLPPWWLYGFYICIIFAAIYLYRYHVVHSAPSSKEEFEMAVAKGDADVKAFLASKGESVDETTVELLTSAEDLSAGQKIFTTPGKCATCHAEDGGGNAVGPNLVDDYWIYSGDIKSIFKVVKYGANNGMKSWKDELSAKEMAQVSSYIKSLKGTKPKEPKEPQGNLYVEDAAQ
ncbi:MAG: c-type cytochrome [Bacteroidetes bacterium]|nr:c-type cytochrome [Bacteroidota bacterium]